jgi:hypothetical protein
VLPTVEVTPLPTLVTPESSWPTGAIINVVIAVEKVVWLDKWLYLRERLKVTGKTQSRRLGRGYMYFYPRLPHFPDHPLAFDNHKTRPNREQDSCNACHQPESGRDVGRIRTATGSLPCVYRKAICDLDGIVAEALIGNAI